jgi:hypothetical protein
MTRRQAVIADTMARKPNPVGWLARSPRRAFLAIFLVTVAVQGFLLTLVSERHIRPHTRYEITAVAMALYERGEFADPYCLPTGPTAHMPPFFPAFMALVYHLFGPTLTAGYVIWWFAALSFGFMYGMTPWLAGRLGLCPEAGVLGGLAGALLPRFPPYAEALTAVAIGLTLAAFVRRWGAGGTSPSGSLLLGLAFGAAFHVNPTLLPVVLGCVLFELWWIREPRRWRDPAIILLGATLACVPWTWRNHSTLHGLFFIRSNLGLELRMGNHEGAGGHLDISARRGTERHPRTKEDEARRVQELGELAYMRAAGREALDWIAGHPIAFLRLTGSRIVQFWFGPLHALEVAALITLLTALAACGAVRAWPGLTTPQRAALVIPLALYPLIHYVVGYEERYRMPLEGLLLLLAGACVWRQEARPPDRTP